MNGGNNISVKNMRHLIQSHYERCEDKKIWNNIPQCVAFGLKNLVNSQFEMDKNVSDKQKETDS